MHPLPRRVAARELGCTVEVLGATAKTLRLTIADPSRGLAGQVTLLVPDGDRRCREIACRVLRRAGQGQWLASPVSVSRPAQRRAAPRRVAAHDAVIRPDAGDGDPAREVDVHLLDISAGGLAFATDRRLAVGDRLACMLNFEGRLVFARLIATNVSAHGFGRRRVGCRIVEMSGADRDALRAYARRHALPDRRREAIEAVRAAVRILGRTA